MVPTRTFAALARVRPSSSAPLTSFLAYKTPVSVATAAFSSSALRSATPAGAPPSGFRLPRTERWDESKESSLDKAGKYFLMTEMLRGMYVVLEQFFRPPLVFLISNNLLRASNAKTKSVTQSTTPLKKAPYLLASAANMLYEDIPPARSAASPASCAKLYAPPQPSRLKRRRERMVVGGRRDMIST